MCTEVNVQHLVNQSKTKMLELTIKGSETESVVFFSCFVSAVFAAARSIAAWRARAVRSVLSWSISSSGRTWESGWGCGDDRRFFLL